MRKKRVCFSVSEVEADSGECRKCGLEKVHAGLKRKRKRERYPWLVKIRSPTQPRCLGTLISSRYVLTASHCLVYWVQWKRNKYLKLTRPTEVKVVFLKISQPQSGYYLLGPPGISG